MRLFNMMADSRYRFDNSAIGPDVLLSDAAQAQGPPGWQGRQFVHF